MDTTYLVILVLFASINLLNVVMLPLELYVKVVIDQLQHLLVHVTLNFMMMVIIKLTVLLVIPLVLLVLVHQTVSHVLLDIILTVHHVLYALYVLKHALISLLELNVKDCIELV